jgi:hypothetical protein
MIEVKICIVIEKVPIAAPMGIRYIQPHQYLQLRFAQNNEVIPDNFYMLKQGERTENCSVIGGRVRGAEWVDTNLPVFIV